MIFLQVDILRPIESPKGACLLLHMSRCIPIQNDLEIGPYELSAIFKLRLDAIEMIQLELEGGNEPQKKPTGLLINNDVLLS